MNDNINVYDKIKEMRQEYIFIPIPTLFRSDQWHPVYDLPTANNLALCLYNIFIVMQQNRLQCLN